MAKRKLVTYVIDVVAAGEKGGKARAASMTAAERKASADAAIAQRWKKYYQEHPEKLKERLEKEARKAAKKKGKKAGSK